MIKKIVLILLLTFIVSAEEDVAFFNMKENDIDVSIAYPKTIRQGDTIKLIGIMKNGSKRDAYMGGLTISFPQFEQTQGVYHKNTFDKISDYSYPDKIYNRKLKKRIKAKYYMIEGWENHWETKTERGFFVELKIPYTIDTLTVNIRGILIFDKKKRKSIKIPAKSNSIDQQGYMVKQIQIPIISKNKIVKKNKKKIVTKRDAHQHKRVVGDSITSGTGFFINSHNLVTNYHVIGGCREIKLIKNQFKSEAEIAFTDKINDLAVLSSEKKNSNILHFRGKKSIRIGETVIAMGYPLGELLGNNIKLTTGNISSLTGLFNDSSKLQLTAPIQPGNSGGPLLDIYGNVIGVVYAKLNNNIAQNVNLAIKAYTLRMFLDTNSVKYQTNSNNVKQEIVDIADKAKRGVVQIICYK